jgi:hypothetical protein
LALIMGAQMALCAAVASHKRPISRNARTMTFILLY